MSVSREKSKTPLEIAPRFMFFKRSLGIWSCWVCLNAIGFGYLVSLIYDPAVLLPVWEQVLATSRSARCDAGFAQCLPVSTFVGLCCALSMSLLGGFIVLFAASKEEKSPFDAYELGRMLGEGAFGTVWRATKEDKGVTHIYALKVLKIQNIDEANFGIAEAMRLACISHRCVVSVHEQFFHKVHVSGKNRFLFGVSPYRLCIAQELCDGDLETEITTWAADNGLFHKDAKDVSSATRPAWDQLMRIFSEIVQGVDALHAKAIIHRDLKPANIFISADHKHVKVGDLGLAENLLRPGANVEGLECAGTDGYMAPEVRDEKPYSTLADTWSLGCILVDMAFPIEYGGWSLGRILNGRENQPWGKNLRYLCDHESIAERNDAQIIIENCLVEEPECRWSTTDILNSLEGMRRVMSEVVAPWHGRKESYDLLSSLPTVRETSRLLDTQ